MSRDPLQLGFLPTAVRVAEGPSEQVFEAMVEANAVARAEAAAEAAQERTDTAVRAELAALVDQTIEAVHAERETVESTIAESATKIALQIAQVVLRTELDEGRYELERVVRECLAKGTKGRGECQVFVCQPDFDRLQTMRLRSKTELLVDPSLKPGEVRVESPQGLVVRDPDAVLDRITEALQEALRS